MALFRRKVKKDTAVRKTKRKSINHPEKLSKEELIEVVKDMAHDWTELNAIHNRTARQRDWCGSYEARQHDYNANFRVFQLQGRNSVFGRLRSEL